MVADTAINTRGEGIQVNPGRLRVYPHIARDTYEDQRQRYARMHCREETVLVPLIMFDRTAEAEIDCARGRFCPGRFLDERLAAARAG